MAFCAFSFKLLLKSTHQHSLKSLPWTTGFWSLIFMLVRRHKTEGFVKHKNIINKLFSHSPILFITNIICTKIHMDTKKGSLGVPKIIWVLTPSLCVTNPLTCNLWHFISFDLKTSYLLGFVRTFPFSLGNNKSAVATLVLLTLNLYFC